jgi:threonine/homoserine/homoserine lactone efflux protein
VPPHARAGWVGRGHRFAAYPRCSADMMWSGGAALTERSAASVVPAFSHGLRFGLLLQLAVGPVCLFVFRTGSEHGVWRGVLAVLGVALVDALYIALAGLGVTRWAESGGARHAFQRGGAAIIALFAVDLMASAVGMHLLPSMALGARMARGASTFLAAVFLTSSNPLTIVFWAGVFSAKVAAGQYRRKHLWLFSLGCIGATVAFLGVTAVAGALVGRIASALVVRILNVAVGCALLYFAVRLALQNEVSGHAAEQGDEADEARR